MRRWLWIFAFLLSVGLNIGWLGHRLWLQQRGASEAELFTEMVEAEGPDAADNGPSTEDSSRRPLPRLLERLADDLRLTGEERQVFLRLQQQYFERALSDRRFLGALQQRARREIVRPQPDREVVEALVVQINGVQLQMEQGFVDHLFASRRLLGPREQRRFLLWMGRLRQQRPSAWRSGGEGPGAWRRRQQQEQRSD